MNFFEHQDRARRQSRRLTLLFLLAVLAIVVVIDGILLLVLGTRGLEPGVDLRLADLVRANLPLLGAGALTTLAVIGLASLFRITGLRSGGGQVARQLGGTLVESDSRDLKRRRLRNVVEEIALASGVPVPEIYVLEQEAGINAFAAGYTPSDAAVAVTRGALEKLDRDELQGVIAHEFSHILNGDMRINIRLMGALFGILMLALIGRRVLVHARFGRSDRNGAAVVLIAFGLMAVGYVGLFFGRWIKAALSRQREYLADASAVQFTRDPQGIGGALKKIAVYTESSYLNSDPEEVAHMLFGSGRRMALFATHPPLNERIARVDPQFRPEELDRLRESILRARARELREVEEQRVPGAKTAEREGFDAGRILDYIGKPDWHSMLAAAAVAASLPHAVRRAAHSTEWAPEALFYSLLNGDEQVRERQLLTVARKMGADSEAQVRALLSAAGLPASEQRLPLLEIAFPALKRRPPDFISRALETVKEMTAVDGQVDVFEYLLARSIAQHVWASWNPNRVRMAGNRSVADCSREAIEVIAILARHGHADGEAADAAYRAGCDILGLDGGTTVPGAQDWVARMDSALPALDRLTAGEKAKFVRALSAVAMHDGRMVAAELELLRAVCDLIHVPLPVLTAPGGE